MDIVKFSADMQEQVNDFLNNVFRALAYHILQKIDMQMWQESHYMHNGCFQCLINDNNVIGIIAIRKIDDGQRMVD